MAAMETSNRLDPAARGAGTRFLKVFALTIVLVVVLVAAFTRFAYWQMLKPQNQTIVQLIDGWARIYKPILIDHSDPQVVVFGASWARDAFDPLETGRLTGREWFNHAVSGATPYEMRRFVESSMDLARLEAVVLNLDTFLRPDAIIRMKRGFDEALLDTDPEGIPTRWLTIQREIAITLSGAAIGNSLEVLDAVRMRDLGVDPAEYLDSYERHDFAGREADIERMRAAARELGGGAAAPTGPVLSELPLPPGTAELERVLGLLCRKSIDVHAYFTPVMILQGEQGRGLASTLHGLDVQTRRRRDCRARLHFYNFNYPNAVTQDGLEARERFSQYYRPDGHPRPTLGLLMVARMFGTEFPDDTAPAIVADFGFDLLAAPDAEVWLRNQAFRMDRMLAAVRSP
jgi:hypothetical protein